MSNSEGAYLGIDISSRSTVLSIYKSNMEEPATVSTVLGEENYSIPTVLAKRLGMGQWFFGDEAVLKSRVKEAVLVEDLYNLALANENVFLDGEDYAARDLMVIFQSQLTVRFWRTLSLDIFQRQWLEQMRRLRPRKS